MMPGVCRPSDWWIASDTKSTRAIEKECNCNFFDVVDDEDEADRPSQKVHLCLAVTAAAADGGGASSRFRQARVAKPDFLPTPPSTWPGRVAIGLERHLSSICFSTHAPT